MLKPPELDKPSKRPSFMSSKEMRYILVMVLVFLLMCFVIVTQLFRKKPEPATQVPANVGASVRPYDDAGSETGISTSETEDPIPGAESTKPPPPREPFVEDEKIWDLVDDDALDTVEDDPFYYCLHMINSMNQAEIDARAQKDKITIEDLVKNPAACRGKFVSFQGGYIRELYSIAKRQLNRAGIRVHWEGVIHNAKVNKFFTVFFIEKQRAFDWNPHTGKKDVVKATGVFLKRHRFTNAKGTVGHNYIIVARMLEEGTEAELESSWGSPILWVAGGVVIVILAVLFVLMRMESRKASEAEHAFKVRHRKKLTDDFVRGQVKNPDAVKRGKDKPDRPAEQ